MPDSLPEKDSNDLAYKLAKLATASGDVDASDLLSDPKLKEKLRRLKSRKMVGYGPHGLIYRD